MDIPTNCVWNYVQIREHITSVNTLNIPVEELRFFYQLRNMQQNCVTVTISLQISNAEITNNLCYTECYLIKLVHNFPVNIRNVKNGINIYKRF